MRDSVLALDRVLGADEDLVPFADKEALGRSRDVGGLVAAFGAGDDLARFDEVAGSSQQFNSGGQGDMVVVLLAACDLDPCARVATDDLDDAVDVADLGLALGDAAFE